MPVLENNKRIQQRYQVIPLTIAQTNPANNLQQASATLDRAYSLITGIAIQVTNDGFNTNDFNQFLIGAKTQRQVWVDPIPGQLWNPDGAPLDYKFLSVQIPYGSGDTFFITAQNLIALNTAAQLYMTVRLIEDFTQMPLK